jgi:hypothetical protein
MNYERSANGYKETEIVVIPEDWEVKELEEKVNAHLAKMGFLWK